MEDTPDMLRAKNATQILNEIKYKQSAEMEKANFTSVVDTPEIIHAQQVKNLSSQKKYKEDAEKSMSYYETVLDTPEMQRVRENQKNFSLVLYKEDVSPGTAIGKTPEMLRVKQTQDHISSVKYKEAIGQGTPIPDLPEVKRVKETQKHISSVLPASLLCHLSASTLVSPIPSFCRKPPSRAWGCCDSPLSPSGCRSRRETSVIAVAHSYHSLYSNFSVANFLLNSVH